MHYSAAEVAEMAPEPGLLDGLRDGTWLDRQDFPPLRYHVPGIIPEGLTVLAGAPKVGKSWLVLGCGLAVAAPGRALGKIECERRPVCYFALEDGDRRMQDRCRKLLDSPWRPREPIPAAFSYLTDVLPGQILPTLGEYLAMSGHLAPLVIVDTLGRCLPPAQAGESAYGRDYRVVSDLKALADRYPGTAIVACHHDRKATTADFVDSVSGTNAIAGAADTVLLLTRPRGEAAGLLQVTGRDVTEGCYAVSFDWCAWTLDGADLAEAGQAAEARRATAGLGDRSAEIAGYVNGQQDPVTPARVAAALGLGNDAAGKYLRRLADTGRIRKAGRGTYTPRPSVRMPESPHSPPHTQDSRRESGDARSDTSDARTGGRRGRCRPPADAPMRRGSASERGHRSWR